MHSVTVIWFFTVLAYSLFVPLWNNLGLENNVGRLPQQSLDYLHCRVKGQLFKYTAVGVLG